MSPQPGVKLSAEVRYFAALIVRCDEQQPLLLEQRDRVRPRVGALKYVEPLERSTYAAWLFTCCFSRKLALSWLVSRSNA